MSENTKETQRIGRVRKPKLAAKIRPLINIVYSQAFFAVGVIMSTDFEISTAVINIYKYWKLSFSFHFSMQQQSLRGEFDAR